MDTIISQIEKGRKRLMVLIGLGLFIPLGFAFFFFFVSLGEYISSGPAPNYFFLQEEESVFCLFFLFISIIGFFIGRAMYKGKEWAHGLWSSVGIFGGGLIFMLSLVASMADTRAGLPILAISTYILVITLQTSLNKGVRAYLKSLHSLDSIEDKIEEIGK